MKKSIGSELLKFDIVNLCSETIVCKLNSYLNKEGLEYEKLRLGTEAIVLSISKIIIILGLAICLDTFWATVVMLIANYFIRLHAFGLHAQNPTICLITTTLMFILPPVLLKSFYLNNYTLAIMFLVCNILLYMYAPADTENHPLLGQSFRQKLKFKTVVNGIILMIVTLFIPYKSLKLLVFLSVLYVIIGILPITYKILKRSCNNYEKYE